VKLTEPFNVTVEPGAGSAVVAASEKVAVPIVAVNGEMKVSNVLPPVTVTVDGDVLVVPDVLDVLVVPEVLVVPDVLVVVDEELLLTDIKLFSGPPPSVTGTAPELTMDCPCPCE
jgi:hypothetical protein